MINAMAYIENNQPFRTNESNGLFVRIDPDTVDMGNEYRATGHDMLTGTAWRLWSAPDARPVEKRRILAMKIGAGTEKVHNALLI